LLPGCGQDDREANGQTAWIVRKMDPPKLAQQLDHGTTRDSRSYSWLEGEIGAAKRL